MRILFASTQGAGHVGPLLPFARAALAAGHTVVLAAPAARSELPLARLDLAARSRRGLGAGLHAGVARARAHAAGAVHRPRRARPRCRGCSPPSSASQPDLIVRETCEFASARRGRAVRRAARAGRHPPRHARSTPTRRLLAIADACAAASSACATPSASCAPRSLTMVPRSLSADVAARVQRFRTADGLPPCAPARPRLRVLRLRGAAHAALPAALPRHDRGAGGLPVLVDGDSAATPPTSARSRGDVRVERWVDAGRR